MRRLLPLALLVALTPPLRADQATDLCRKATEAEARGNPQTALDLFQKAERARPGDPKILEGIARQYADLCDGRPTDVEKQDFARRAVDFAQQAVQLDRDSATVLSLAIGYGKLALWTKDTSEQIKYTRLTQDNAEQALALDPNNAWAHHVLGRWHYEVVREAAKVSVSSRLFARLFMGLPSASTAEAVSHLLRATELEPGQPAHWAELGFAYLYDGQPDQARKAWEKGISLPGPARYEEEAKGRAGAALKRLDLPANASSEHPSP